ncbi:MAG: hypothetical protein OEY64_12485 [Nitrospinota bacterium]|nr:hypothetical protein [Nitrospinota bacterium]
MGSRGAATSGPSSQRGLLLLSSGGYKKPKNLLDAISEIQQFYIVEKDQVIDPNYFTWNMRIDLSLMAFSSAIKNGMIGILFTPLAVGVIDRLIPVFGDETPTTFDKGFVIVLALSHTMLDGIVIASMSQYYVGNITRRIIKSIISSTLTGAFLTILFTVILYGYLYNIILEPEMMKTILTRHFGFMKYGTLESIYLHLFDLRSVLFESAILIVIAKFIYSALVCVPVLYPGMKWIINFNKEDGL